MNPKYQISFYNATCGGGKMEMDTKCMRKQTTSFDLLMITVESKVAYGIKSLIMLVALAEQPGGAKWSFSCLFFTHAFLYVEWSV